jgi:hypothetical protein
MKYLITILCLMALSDIVFKTRSVLTTLLFVDCFINMLFRGSFHESLSARAHRLRYEEHPVWGWTAGFIDALFFWQRAHCQTQYWRERQYGGAWKAWRAAA